MRFSRVSASAVMAFGVALVPMHSASAVSNVPATCKLDAVAVQKVLGVSDVNKYAGPEILVGGTCSWRTTDPNCFLRVLSVRPHVTSKDIAAVTDLLAQAKPFDRASKALGKNAFFAHTDLGPGAAIAIERIYVPSGDKNWVEVTLSGRLGPDGSRGLLVTAAKAVPRLASL